MIWLLFYVIVRLYSSHNVSGTRLRAGTKYYLRKRSWKVTEMEGIMSVEKQSFGTQKKEKPFLCIR